MNKKYFVIVAFLLFLAVAVLSFRFLFGSSEDTWVCEGGQWVRHGNPSVPVPTGECGEEIVGGDIDEHGCLIGAGYSWCEPKGICLREWEEACEEWEEDLSSENEESIAQAVKQAIVEKRGVDANDLVISVNKIEGNYAQGKAGSPTPGPGGGIWFAAKVDDAWELVWDGNGSIYCSDLVNYPDYPTNMISECYDEVEGEIVNR
jgi:hypothetical protein